MIVSESHKFVFFHVPKSGGSSMTALFRPYSVRQPREPKEVGEFGWHLPYHVGGMHVSVARTWQQFGKEKWWDYFWFGFVRNPFDMVVSAWRMNRPIYAAPEGRRRERLEENNVPVPISDLSLADYLKYELGNEGFPHIRYTQSHLLLNSPRKVDFIGRYENLHEDWEKVAATVGLKERLPHQNRSVRENDYRSYYDDRTRALVEAFFREDLENFGYAF